MRDTPGYREAALLLDAPRAFETRHGKKVWVEVHALQALEHLSLYHSRLTAITGGIALIEVRLIEMPEAYLPDVYDIATGAALV